MQGSLYREGLLAGPTGPAGWYRGPPTPHGTDHPLQPRWGFRGPLRCLYLGGLFNAVGGWTRYYPPVLPTRYTHPGTHPARTTPLPDSMTRARGSA